PHRDPPEETSAAFSISFVERGAFELEAWRRGERFCPGMVLVERPGLAYRCRHREEFPEDVCLSVQFSDPSLAEQAGPLSLGPAVRATNRLAYMRLRLLADQTARQEPLALEGRALELLGAVAEAQSGGPSRLFRPEQLSWYARRVERARQVLEERYAEPMPLERLAREAGMSPFHFARVFRQLAGAPPHRYLLGVRLRRARQALEQGRGVTETCFETGFSSLSHFIRQFRRAFGASPSRLRA
ncbi:MAG: helix-turn-helix domain-containing protein, partial [Thermoanaerobaculia bacterium]